MSFQKYGAPESVESVESAEGLANAGQPQPELLQDGAVAPDGEPVENSSSDLDSEG